MHKYICGLHPTVVTVCKYIWVLLCYVLFLREDWSAVWLNPYVEKGYNHAQVCEQFLKLPILFHRIQSQIL